MMPSHRWLRKKKACTLFPWTWVATLILSQHLFVTWHFYTHLLLSKYVYEQLLPLCVGVSFVLHCFLGGLQFFSNYSSCLLFICFPVPTQTLLHLYGNLTLLLVFPWEVQSRNICRNVCVHLSGMVFPWEVQERKWRWLNKCRNDSQGRCYLWRASIWRLTLTFSACPCFSISILKWTVDISLCLR